jgi:hypothetical protein
MPSFRGVLLAAPRCTYKDKDKLEPYFYTGVAAWGTDAIPP